MDLNIGRDEISNIKLYEPKDLVKLNCNSCMGCHACCKDMGSSVILDPFDIYRFTSNLNISFQELLSDRIELNVVEGIILPNVKMNGEMKSCSFLNKGGRCSIHDFRPGICRIFPLGRYYINNSFKYFLYTNGCISKERAKTKVKKWIDTPDLKKNEQFIIDWHYFIKDVQNAVKNSQDDNFIKSINMYILNDFYIKPYVTDVDFYLQFNERLSAAKNLLQS